MPWLARWLWQAVSVLRIGIGLLIALHALASEDVAGLRTKATAAFDQGRNAEAEEELRALLKITPDDPAALGFLGSVLDREHRWAEAETYYQRALRMGPASLFLLNNYANHCELNGDLVCAEREFRKVLPLDPAHRNANLHLARLAASRRDGPGALAFLEHAGAGAGDDFSVALIRAEALYWSGRREESDALLESLMAQAGGKADELVPIAAALVRMQQYQRAFPLLAKLREQAPENSDVLLLMAKSLEQLKRYSEAAVAYDAYLKLVPGDEFAKRDRAFLDVRMAGVAEAIGPLKAFHQRHPKDPEGMYDLAVAMSVTDMPAAATLLTQALAVAPDFTAARYARAIAWNQVGRSREAAADLEKVRGAEPQNAEIAATLGSTYLSLGEVDRAVEVLQEAQRSAPQNRSVLVVLSRALKMQGKPEAAREVLARIPQTGPPARANGSGLLELLHLAQ